MMCVRGLVEVGRVEDLNLVIRTRVSRQTIEYECPSQCRVSERWPAGSIRSGTIEGAEKRARFSIVNLTEVRVEAPTGNLHLVSAVAGVAP